MGDTVRTTYRELTYLEEHRIKDVKLYGQAFLDFLGEVPSGREVSIAKTKVEEAVMWAVKGLSA